MARNADAQQSFSIKVTYHLLRSFDPSFVAKFLECISTLPILSKSVALAWKIYINRLPINDNLDFFLSVRINGVY